MAIVENTAGQSAMLQGRVAVITGGARGLGYAIADRLHHAGAKIVIADRPEVLQEIALPQNWEVCACDLLVPGAEKQLELCAARLGRVDVVVANAGEVPRWRRISELDMAEWSRVFQLNVAGVALTLKTFAPALVQSQHASVVIMASVNAYRAHAPQALYTATKHAVLGLTRAAAQDMGVDGIRVNAIAPGPIATDALLDRIDRRHVEGGPDRKATLAAFASATAMKKIATPEQVADVALFLASEQSAGMTGSLLPVECGMN